MDYKDKQNSYSSILKYAALFGGVQGIAVIITLVRNKFMALLLGPDGLGLQALFNSTIKVLSDTTNMGISMSGVKYISAELSSGDTKRTDDAVSVIRSWSMLAAVTGFMACIVLSPLLNKFTFSWGDHTLHYIFLSPVVALTAISAGETVILKGARHLRELATISLAAIIGTLLLTIPIYYLFSERGIVPALFVTALLQMVLTVACSWRLYPMRISLKRDFLSKVKALVVLGWAFILAGIMGSLCDFIIRSVISNRGTLNDVSMYNYAYMIVMTCGGMVFASMETDYFPRLSALKECGKEFNDIINKQMEVSILIISPILAILTTTLPVLVPLLFSDEFLPMTPLAQVLVAAIYLRALRLPMNYIPLARSDGFSYLLMEGIYAVIAVATVVTAYLTWGLLATGFALVVTAALDLFILLAYMNRRYGFVISWKVVRYASVQLTMGAMICATTLTAHSWLYWCICTVISGASMAVSIKILHSKTHLWDVMRKKLSKRWDDITRSH